MSAPRLVFVDTETTSLDRDTRRIWEAALIVREPPGPDATAVASRDSEHRCFVDIRDIDLPHANPFSLGIGGFYDRHPQIAGGRPADRLDSTFTKPGPDGDPVAEPVVRERELAVQVEWLTRGAVLVGAVPWFDEHSLDQTLRRHGLVPAWHYHLVDVETLAAGVLLLEPPWDFDLILREYGLAYDEANRHTAMGDTRIVRDLYDKVLAR